MSKSSTKPVAAALGAAIAGLALSGSAFSMNPLAQGYMLGASAAPDAHDHAAAEGKCGEGKCGEGKCGMAKMDTDKDGRLSQAEFAAAHDGDASKFAAHDADGDGFISAAEISACHAKKAESATTAADAPPTEGKAAMEGKCGEGKCGGAI
ncbi:MAG TPA: hypothetical protein VFM73_02605 [Xanthomonadaceae bacterium]|nr:hypothetical protein [Xanthomonadaceae bacterium]